MATPSLGFQSFFQTQLTAGIDPSATNIQLDNVPDPTEGFLVIDPLNAANREIIYYTSKDGVSVTVPSGAGNGRGYDGTTATDHLAGVSVIMAPVGAMFEALQDGTGVLAGAITPEKRSGGFKVGLIQSGAGTGNKSFTGVGFRPKAIIFLGQRSSSTDGLTNLSLWDGTDARNIRAGARTAATAGAYAAAGTAVVQVSGFAAGAESTVVSASGVSMDADGFTLNFVTNAADTAIAYLAMG